MPFLRFSRDKRGVEHFYLVHATENRRGRPSDHRIIYWYRTPPGVKVGREPFDPEAQRLIEAEHPGVPFEWEKYRNTPFPPPQPEQHWRERRLAAKAARRLQREEEEAEAALAAAESGVAAAAEAPAIDEREADAVHSLADGAVMPDAEVGAAIASAGETAPAMSVSPPPAESTPGLSGQRRRRRRRRGRRARRPDEAAAGSPVQTESVPATSLKPDDVPDDDSSDADPDVPDGEEPL